MPRVDHLGPKVGLVHSEQQGALLACAALKEDVYGRSAGHFSRNRSAVGAQGLIPIAYRGGPGLFTLLLIAVLGAAVGGAYLAYVRARHRRRK